MSKEPLEKILYVEDDEFIAEVTIMTLEDLGGFNVKHCASGKDALLALPDYKPQLVLMDVMMPGMDGPETMETMRKMPEGESIPIIFMTAKAQTHEQKTYMDMGALGVIVKPFDPAKLCGTIEGIWQNSGG